MVILDHPRLLDWHLGLLFANIPFQDHLAKVSSDFPHHWHLKSNKQRLFPAKDMLASYRL